MHHLFFFFFFNDTATTEIYTLSLHDALPISSDVRDEFVSVTEKLMDTNSSRTSEAVQQECRDRKSGSAGMPRPDLVCRLLLEKKKKIRYCPTVIGSDTRE